MFKFIFLFGLILNEIIRAPYRAKNRKDKLEKNFAYSLINGKELTVLLVGFVALWALPFLVVLTPFFKSFDYTLPVMYSIFGVCLILFSSLILWRAHKDLADEWSPTLEINKNHHLVTTGIYTYIRHPIYASIFLFSIAQVMLLQNWVTSIAGVTACLLMYFLRIPQEENMMIEHFGQQYTDYMKKVGGIFIKF
jgi:protein-S-isoprenylcysteine O-methyltransferase Ste14